MAEKIDQATCENKRYFILYENHIFALQLKLVVEIVKVQQRHPKGLLKNRFIREWPTQLYKHLSYLWIKTHNNVLGQVWMKL